MNSTKSNIAKIKHGKQIIKYDIYKKILKFCNKINCNELNFYLGIMSLYYSRINNKKDLTVEVQKHIKKRTDKKTFINTKLKQLNINIDYSDTFTAHIRKIERIPKVVDRIEVKDVLRRNHYFEYNILLRNNDNNESNNISFIINSFPQSNQTDITVTSLSNTIFSDKHLENNVASHISVIIDEILNYPTKKIKDIQLLSQKERDKLICEWNLTDVNYPNDKCIHQLFEEQFEKIPDNIAVSGPSVLTDNCLVSLSYRELNERANQLAHYLQSKGVGVESFVGICVERSVEMIVCVLGILKAGGAFMPIDPDYPEERILYILEDSECKFVLTQKSIKKTLANVSTEFICIEEDNIQIENESKENAKSLVNSGNLAYLIYTSGSTWKPKGVMSEHSGISNLQQEQRKMFSITKDDVILQFASFSFDAFCWEVFMTLLNGAKLIVSEKQKLKDPLQLAEIIKTNNISIITLSPTMLYLSETDLPSLKNVISAGEPCSARLVKKWASKTNFFNAYGPTETTVCASIYKCHKEDTQAPPIGKPLGNFKLYITDKNLNLLPIGVPGELHIEGAGLARGYLKKEALTKEKFIQNPFSENPNSILYKTGDIVRYRSSGDVEFVGRADNQVKIRGFRIELGEIESAIRKFNYIKDCAVIANNDAVGNKRIIAYIISDKYETNTRKIRKELSKQLPGYMVPSLFVSIDTLPLTPNGKVDKNALPAPDSNFMLSNEYVAASSETENKLVGIWQKVLGIKKAGIHDNFFEVGGDSLLLVALLTEINKKICKNIQIKDLYEYHKISSFIEFLESETSEHDKFINLEQEAVQDENIFSNIKTHESVKDYRNILFTGATGFPGKFLLKELLETSNAKIFILLRESDLNKNFKSLINDLISNELWSERYLDRLIPISGDLGKVNLGMQKEDYEKLSKKVEVIYHNAAFMNHHASYSVMRQVNVEGAKEIIRFAVKNKPKAIQYLSTTDVFNTGGKHRNISFNEHSSIEHEKHPYTSGYTGTKWVAEKLFMTAREKGVHCSIFRLGLITGDSLKGRYKENQWFFTFLKSFHILGCAFNDYLTSISITPVDFAAESIIYISNQKNLSGKTYHIHNPKKTSIEEIVTLYNQTANKPLKLVSFADWIDLARDYINNGNLLPSQVFIHQYLEMDRKKIEQVIKQSGDELSDKMNKLKSEYTVEILKKHKKEFPRIDKYLIATYFRKFNTEPINMNCSG